MRYRPEARVATGSLALPGLPDFQSEWPHLHLRQVVVRHLAAHKMRATPWNIRRVAHTQHDCRKGLMELANVGLHVCGPWAEGRVLCVSLGQAHLVTNWRRKTCEDPHKTQETRDKSATSYKQRRQSIFMTVSCAWPGAKHLACLLCLVGVGSGGPSM